MLTRRAVMTVLVLVILSGGLSCATSTTYPPTSTNYPPTFTSIIKLTVKKTSLEEAAAITGVKVPVPTYLPEGYQIQEVYVQDHSVKLLISDEAIEKKLVTHTDAAGTRQHYEVKCKMRLGLLWWEEGPGIRLPWEKVRINEGAGYYSDGGDDYHLITWDSRYKTGQKGFYEFTLSAIKGIPKKELIKVAESVAW